MVSKHYLCLRLERGWVLHLYLIYATLPQFSSNLITASESNRCSKNTQCSNNQQRKHCLFQLLFLLIFLNYALINPFIFYCPIRSYPVDMIQKLSLNKPIRGIRNHCLHEYQDLHSGQVQSRPQRRHQSHCH